jgi:hypothetical protein
MLSVLVNFRDVGFGLVILKSASRGEEIAQQSSRIGIFGLCEVLSLSDGAAHDFSL